MLPAQAQRVVFQQYSLEDGLPLSQVMSMREDRRGYLWFGTIKGVNKYEHARDRLNQRPPRVHVTSLRLFFKSQDWETQDWSRRADTTRSWSGLPRGLELPFDQNHLTFDFAGLSYTVPEKVRYRYKLEGFDEASSCVLIGADALAESCRALGETAHATLRTAAPLARVEARFKQVEDAVRRRLRTL